jgi:uncharacterized YigZ family protein
MSYSIPAQCAEAEIEIKKSRFIALAKHISNRESGMDWLNQVKTSYPDARHHCWAYLIGSPSCPTNAGMSDDGEPSGTAGKPILAILQHKAVGDIMVIVVRYFGGIKLGAGGLTRAYSQAAQSVMSKLMIQNLIPMQRLRIACDYAQEQRIRHWVAQHQGAIIEVNYDEPISIEINLPQTAVMTLTKQLSVIPQVMIQWLDSAITHPPQ